MSLIDEKRRARQGAYSPGPSYYDRWEHAAKRGFASGRVAEELDAAVSASAHIPSRERNYRELSDGWMEIVAKLPGASTLVRSGTWSSRELEVGVRPLLAVRNGDRSQVIWGWMKSEPISDDTSKGVLRVLLQTMPQLAEGGAPVVADVRRGILIAAPTRWRRSTDAWLAGEAVNLATMWAEGEAEAS
jgi:hypothetical protein